MEGTFDVLSVSEINQKWGQSGDGRGDTKSIHAPSILPVLRVYFRFKILSGWQGKGEENNSLLARVLEE